MLSAGRLFSACVELAEAAGTAIRNVHCSGALGVTLKGENDPCTEADLRAQRLIVASLAAQFPLLRIVAEETVQWTQADVLPTRLSIVSESEAPISSLPACDTVVYVDPLDGTINFTRNELEGVTTLIGVAFRGRPVFGAVQAVFEAGFPVYFGGPGLGIWRWSEGQKWPLQRQPSSDFSVVSTKYHDTPEISRYLSACGAQKILRVGGSGGKGLMVLRGDVSAYVYPGSLSKKWDICANEALLLAAGGQVTDMRGNVYTYGAEIPVENPGGFIETVDAGIHSALVRASERIA